MNDELKELLMLPGLIQGIAGNSYTDGLPMTPIKEPGLPPKQYGIMLSRRRKLKCARNKRRRKR